MILHIRGGRLVDPSQGIDELVDLHIENGAVSAIFRMGEKSPPANRVIDAKGCIVSPGFVDLHVHLREPGQTEKEDIESGSFAAVAGGFTSILCMPNTKPVNDSVAVTRQILERAKKVGKCRVYPVGSVSRNLEGKELSPMADLKAAGCIAFSDDGRPCYDTALFREAMELAKKLDVPIIEHCEELSLSSNPTIHDGDVARSMGLEGIPVSVETTDVARTAVLAAEIGTKVHLAHLSCADSIELVKAFKAKVKNITTEVTPHHLVLTDETVKTLGTNAKMYPPLRLEEDCRVLRKALVEGILDTVATDHAPHTEKEKNLPYAQAPNGVIGLETALPVLLTLVEKGELTLLKLIERMSTTPAQIAGIRAGSLKVGMPADITIFSVGEKRLFKTKKFLSKSQNSPFRNFEGRGRVRHTLVNGNPVFGESL